LKRVKTKAAVHEIGGKILTTVNFLIKVVLNKEPMNSATPFDCAQGERYLSTVVMINRSW